MTLGCLDPVTDPLWTALVSRRRGGIFHSSLWLGALQDAYGFPFRASVLSDADGQPTAGIPYACLDGPPAPRLIAAPFCDTCDPLFERPGEWGPLLASLEAHRVPIHLRCLDTELPDQCRLTVSKRARWHTLLLPASTEDRWKALDPSARRAIRKAKREGLQVRPLEPGPDLSTFHRLHVALRKAKYGLLAQPSGFFEALACRFQAASAWHALGAWVGDRLVAGTIYLRWGVIPSTISSTPRRWMPSATVPTAYSLGKGWNWRVRSAAGSWTLDRVTMPAGTDPVQAPVRGRRA